MITKTVNRTTMKLQAVCDWPANDVLICQEWDHPQTGKHTFYIDLSADEAELLIVEMQAAIVEARKIEAEYVQSQVDTL